MAVKYDAPKQFKLMAINKGENLLQDIMLITMNILCTVKENNLRPDKKIHYILGLKGPIIILQRAANPH